MERTRVDVLIVEDYADSRELLGLTLRRRGFSVLLAGDAEEALAGLERAIPALAFIDLRLPDMDSAELAWEIRRRLAGEHVVLVALTGLQGTCQAERGHAFDGLLHKPILPSELAEVAKRALRGDSATESIKD